MKRETWQYAKRQMTWFKKDGEILWFDPEDLAGMRGRVASFLYENEGKG
jgi:tRNA dimethylallyltransferase